MSADGALTASARVEALPRIAEAPRRAPVDWGAVAVHALLLLCVAVIAFPLYYAFVISTQTVEEVIARPPMLSPSGHMFENYVEAWTRAHMARLLWNSAIVAGVSASLRACAPVRCNAGLGKPGLTTRLPMRLQTLPQLLHPRLRLLPADHVGCACSEPQSTSRRCQSL